MEVYVLFKYVKDKSERRVARIAHRVWVPLASHPI